MTPSIHIDLQALWRKASSFVLAIFWICGILFGVWICYLAGDSLIALMRRAVFCSVSIVGLLTVASFPFLLSALAVSISGPGLLLPVCFAGGFLYGYCSFAVFRSFYAVGWLIRPLLCFGIFTMAPVTYLYWLRHISGERKPCRMEIFFFLCIAVLVGTIDYSLISPFLAELLF